MIITGTHRLGAHSQRAGDTQVAPVSIGEGVWIGARAIVMPGVVIGDGCVIAAGAVVISVCLPDGMYAGVPARRIKDLASI
ncbi:acyltransferase [Plantibacter sp. Mn2098]|uniref:acyltransferase n=1 Tax=Plantibacter sp. Mn2098 TaxID=3395266 RepID=UPI003BC84D5E